MSRKSQQGSRKTAAHKRRLAVTPDTGHAQNYSRIAIEFAEQVLADRYSYWKKDSGGKKRRAWKGRHHCRLLKLAAARFLSDLDRSTGKPRNPPPWRWDAWEANNACDFIEQLPHVEGKWESSTIDLVPAQVFFIVQIFGWRDSGRDRRINTALFCMARKNAKSTLAACVLIYCLCCEDEIGPQIITAATTGDQARIVFDIAKRMVEKTHDLREAFGLEPYAKAIASPLTGGTFKAINAKASSQDGLNPSAACLDEIHAHKTSDLLQVIKSAAGARANPLFLYTTTDGYPNPGPWSSLRRFAKQVLEGAVQADHFLVVYFTIDDDDTELDEKNWPKANPLWHVSKVLRREMRKQAIEARHIPSSMAEFRIKKLNKESAGGGAWVNLGEWKKCSGQVDLEKMEGLPCWAGLDLSITKDLCSLRLVWRDLLGLVGKLGQMYTWGRRWCPSAAVILRSEAGTVPYLEWTEAGLIEVIQGPVIDYAVVKAAVIEEYTRFGFEWCGYDRYNAADTVQALVGEGVPMLEFIQGPISFHPAMAELERAYLKHELSHGGDPVLTWQASNLIAREDVNKNKAPDKQRSADKIDDMVALLMAVGVSIGGEPTGSIYDQRAPREIRA